MAKDCYVKKGIRELDISDELRHQLNRLLLNNDSSTESSLSDYEENDLNIIEEDSTTDYQTDSGCECVGNVYVIKQMLLVMKIKNYQTYQRKSQIP